MGNNMKTSKKGIDFIKEYERFIPIADDLGDGGITVGYGHFKDPNIKEGDTITQAQAEAKTLLQGGYCGQECNNHSHRAAS